MKRVLNPSTNPTGIAAALFALWAAGNGAWNVFHNHQAIDPQVVASAIAAVTFLLTRFAVTPIAHPRNGAGEPLVPARLVSADALPLATARHAVPAVVPGPATVAPEPAPVAAEDPDVVSEI